VRLSVLAALEALRIPFTDTRVHAARRALKRARAELRLVRGSIGEAHFRAANRRLRDVGRSLSPWRDARVLIDACDAIGAALAAPASRRLLRALRAELELQHRELRRSSREVEDLTEGAREGLARMLEQARRWPSGPLDAELLAAGAARIYRRGRRSPRPATSRIRASCTNGASRVSISPRVCVRSAVVAGGGSMPSRAGRRIWRTHSASIAICTSCRRACSRASGAVATRRP
jgi:hypothetical protein